MAQHFPDELKHLYDEVEFIGSGGFARMGKATGAMRRVKGAKKGKKKSLQKCLVVSENHGR